MDVVRSRRCAWCAAAWLTRGQRRGYTLTGTLVTVAIIAISTTAAVPPLLRLTTENRLATGVNLFVASLYAARMEAVRRGQWIVMCRSRDGSSCARTSGWQEGWIQFVDQDGDRRRDAGEPILRVQDALGGKITITSGRRRRIVFKPIGSTPGYNATYTFCMPGYPELARAVILSNTGRPRLSRRTPRGGALPCP